MSQEKPNNVCEENTYKELFSSLAGQLRNFLVFRGSEENQANDLVQDAFIKLWENCKKVVPEKAKSYLYTIATNAFKNEMAHLKVRLKYSQSNTNSNTTIETPEFKMEESEFKRKLENAIASLPVTQREVFLMNRIEKKKYAEIAELLGVSVKAVEKRMGKALKHLRKNIKEFK
ncbi:MAG: RNA polymerase sigma-70 factor [Flavobacteriales bacterium]|nr:RNA polymerase sigma-70 factor [Flavobacteriales bacterium]